MACPVCNPLAIPVFGAADVLSFLAPYRGLIAPISIVLLALTLLLRLRTTRPVSSPRQADHKGATATGGVVPHPLWAVPRRPASCLGRSG
jgi:hypothetical protein